VKILKNDKELLEIPGLLVQYELFLDRQSFMDENLELHMKILEQLKCVVDMHS